MGHGYWELIKCRIAAIAYIPSMFTPATEFHMILTKHRIGNRTRDQLVLPQMTSFDLADFLIEDETSDNLCWRRNVHGKKANPPYLFG
jgi:hypothetical protein